MLTEQVRPLAPRQASSPADPLPVRPCALPADPPTALPASLPDWLEKPQDHLPGPDREHYLARTCGALNALVTLLEQPPSSLARKPLASLGLFVLGTGMVMLLSFARTAVVLEIAGVAVLAILALQPLWRLKAVLGLVLVSTAFSGLIMVPALVLGQEYAAGLLLVRTAVGTAWMGLCALMLGGTGLMSALSAARIPPALVMSLGLAMRSLHILAVKARDMVLALRLRSVGKPGSRYLPLGGLTGTLFLESLQFAEEQHQAMLLRGWRRQGK